MGRVEHGKEEVSCDCGHSRIAFLCYLVYVSNFLDDFVFCM